MQAASATGAACKRCGEAAERQVSAGSFKFAHRPSGPAPTNTGASTVDHDLDVIIGRDSQLRLGEMLKRQDRKRSVMRAHGLETGHRLSRLDEGDYCVMTEEEQLAAKRARVVNQDAMRAINEFKERKKRAQQAAS
jgi:hypothetical protein